MASDTRPVKKRKVRRALVTADLGEFHLGLLDTLCAWLQQTSDSTRRITRSEVLRQGIDALYEKVTADNNNNPEVTKT